MRSMRSRNEERAAWSIVMKALALARAFESGGDGLNDRCQLARRERDEGHARAIRVARATRTISITVEGRSVGTLETVVLADDPFLHGADVLSRACRVIDHVAKTRPRSPHCECAGLRTNLIRGIGA